MTRRRSHPAALLALALALTLFAAPAHADDVGLPYLYQREGQGPEGAVTVELESGYGTRQARPFGRDGYEQLARARWQPLPWLMAELGGGLLVTSDTDPRGSFAAEVVFGPLNQADHHLDLSVGVGYLFDYEEVHVPRVRLALGRSFGDFHVVLSGLLEIPTSEARDEVDVIVGLAASYAIFDWWRAGLEVVGEDLEGFWESEEAEGGAKIVLGPTLAFALGERVDLRLNAAAVLAATRNTPTRGTAPAVDSGFLGRLAVGYTF